MYRVQTVQAVQAVRGRATQRGAVCFVGPLYSLRLTDPGTSRCRARTRLDSQPHEEIIFTNIVILRRFVTPRSNTRRTISRLRLAFVLRNAGMLALKTSNDSDWIGASDRVILTVTGRTHTNEPLRGAKTEYKFRRVVAMNRGSCGYWVRAFNQLTSLTAQCGFKDICHPVPARALKPIAGCRRNSGQQYGIAARTIRRASGHQDRRHGKREAIVCVPSRTRLRRTIGIIA